MARKTVDITMLVEQANSMLKNSFSDYASERQGIITFMQTILHETGNYRGFRFLIEDEVKDGYPGINLIDGQMNPDIEARFKNTDPTRIHFFFSNFERPYKV